MDYLDKITEEQAALNDAILERNRIEEKTPEKPTTTCVDNFSFVGLYRADIGWCRLLADTDKRQVKLERLIEE